MTSRQTRAGFTLLEVLVATVLLGILSAGTFAIFSASHQFMLTAQYQLEALNAARSYMEVFESAAYDQLTIPGRPATELLPRVPAIPAPPPPASLAVGWGITPPAVNGGYATATVTTTYNDPVY